MGRLEERLSRLEEKASSQGPQGTGLIHRERLWTRFFYESENARRDLLGEPRRGPTDEEREALEAEHEPVEHVKPPWYSAAAWEKREHRFQRLFAELHRIREAINREETQ